VKASDEDISRTVAAFTRAESMAYNGDADNGCFFGVILKYWDCKDMNDGSIYITGVAEIVRQATSGSLSLMNLEIGIYAVKIGKYYAFVRETPEFTEPVKLNNIKYK
jgi:hypothetical protein